MNIAPMKITRPCGSVLCATLLLLPTLARADNPWLPIPGATRVTLSYVTQSADELYAGTTEAPLPDDLEQDSYALAVEHGLSDAWSLFANLGYASSDFSPAGSNDSGLSDTRLGVAWRLVDEYERSGWPTLTARAAAIIDRALEVLAGAKATAERIEVPANRLVFAGNRVFDSENPERGVDFAKAIGFAEALAITHGDDGVKVSCLCPQAVATRMIGVAEDGGTAGVDGVLSPADVAEAVTQGLAVEQFLILPHAEVQTYRERKTADYDRWLGGMRKLRRKFGNPTL